MAASHEDLTVSDLAAILWDRKILVLTLTLVGAVAAYTYTKLSPARWQARAALLLPISEAGGGSGAIAALVGQGTTSPLNILEGIITSRKTIDRVAEKTGADPDKLKDILDAKGDAPSNQLIITAEDESSERALSYVRTSIHVMSGLTRELGLSVAMRTKEQIQTALKSKEAELANAEDALTAFQKTARTAPDPEAPYSAAAYIKAYGEAKLELQKVERQLNAARKIAESALGKPIDLPTGLPDQELLRQKLIEKENQLQVARIQFNESAREVVILRKEVQALRASLQGELSRRVRAITDGVDVRVADLEAQRILLSWQAQALKQLADIAPAEAAEATRRGREVQTLNEVVAQLRSQFEKARIEADVDKVRWSILEDPYVVKPAVNKRFFRATAFGGAFGFLLAAIWVFGAQSRRCTLRKD